VGVRRVKGTAPIGRPSVQGHAIDNVYGEHWPGRAGNKAPTGTEEVEAWECAESCAVAMLDRQSGERANSRSGSPQREMTSRGYRGGGLGQRRAVDHDLLDLGKPGYPDTGGASRFMATFPADEPEVWECAEGCPVAALDAQTANLLGDGHKGGNTQHPKGYMGQWPTKIMRPSYGDTGGASRFMATFPADEAPTRFLYQPKASAAERSRGLPPGERSNHPCVKPLALMSWLLKLIVPPGGVVLDPFAGSGSTLVAAKELGIEAIGIEQSAEYCAIARQRLGE
jgi:hypothetical protein